MAMNDFGNWILDCNLCDIGFTGLPFTWQRGKVRERLNRVLFNHQWIDIFKSCSVTHAVRRCFDHKPLIIKAFAQSSPIKSSFIFLNMWTLHPDFSDLIEQN